VQSKRGRLIAADERTDGPANARQHRLEQRAQHRQRIGRGPVEQVSGTG